MDENRWGAEPGCDVPLPQPWWRRLWLRLFGRRITVEASRVSLDSRPISGPRVHYAVISAPRFNLLGRAVEAVQDGIEVVSSPRYAERLVWTRPCIHESDGLRDRVKVNVTPPARGSQFVASDRGLFVMIGRCAGCGDAF